MKRLPKLALATCGAFILSMISTVATAQVGTVSSPLESPAEVAAAPSAAAAYSVMNINSGKCLLVRGNADLTPAVQFTCANYADQRWSFVDKGGARYQLRNVNSGKCLLVRGNADLASAVQFTCANYADQYWGFVA